MQLLRFALLVGLFTLTTAHAGVTLTHIHGLAYSPDGKQLMIPSHHGMAVYEGGKWSKATGPQHDYMGFAASAKNLYSSGHPAAGSGFRNPFGLIRSNDGGKTWQKLGMEGETDFHLLAVSWNTNAIYVWNPAPSSRIRSRGLHATVNEGFTWKPARAAGLEGDLRALAVHPDDPAAVAVATSRGIFESSDSGESFTRIAGGEGTSVFFDLDGKHLWYASFDREPRLARARLKQGPITQLKLPPLTDDAVAYIAQNPVKGNEYAIATFERSVFLSQDAGRSWSPMAQGGDGR